MCRLLLTARLAASEGSDAADIAESPLARYRFDARHEKERKAEFERLYARSEEEVAAEVARLEQAKLLEAKLKAQRKTSKPSGRAAGLAAVRSSLSAAGLGGASDLSLSGLPSLASIAEPPPKRARQPAVWLRSKDLSTKRPASEKQISQFESRMRELSLPQRPIPTEANVQLYNQCRAHAVLLVELESKLKRLEYERNVLQLKKQQAASGGAPPPPPAGSKRSRASHEGGAPKRSHH